MSSLRLRLRCLRAAAWSVPVLLVALLGFSACSTVSWQPLAELAREWRGRTLRVGEHCGVVARSSGQAEEVYHFYEEILAALREIEVPPPENVLILVTERYGDLLFDDRDELEAALSRWIGEDGYRGRFIGGSLASGVPFEDAFIYTILKPPVDAPELALPASWQERFDVVMVVASDSARRRAFNDGVNAKMSADGHVFKRLLVEAVWLFVGGTVHAGMRTTHQYRFARLLCIDVDVAYTAWTGLETALIEAAK
ncbi:MAG: hypothetical protein VYD05_09735 [Planctomycetota bacterium]|nr:hypothetical protein [Planctomycetota bacterium]